MTGTTNTQTETAPDVPELVEHLRQRGLLTDGPVTVTTLSGGVSNDVLAVRTPERTVVVKRALGRLRVAEEWLADPRRVLAEAAALQVAATIAPQHVPPVLDVDTERFVIVIGHAEPGAGEWKTDLLAGRVDDEVARQLGAILARWHRATAADASVAAQFDDQRVFEQLRIDPFYRFVAAGQPDVARPIGEVVERMRATRVCLVHGDFSPKNVLLGPASTWVIDWEVAHHGDPAFDLAFLLTHLICKALHRPAAAPDLHRAAGVFLESYRATLAPGGSYLDEAYLTAQTACLLLARIDGKSPAPYLNPLARERGRAIAREALVSRLESLDELWRTLR